uniref:Uncharacterized protein n=1 Tax=Arundo donax TaxID=35708 RepID=A0A0A9F0G4_ARUDO
MNQLHPSNSLSSMAAAWSVAASSVGPLRVTAPHSPAAATRTLPYRRSASSPRTKASRSVRSSSPTTPTR